VRAAQKQGLLEVAFQRLDLLTDRGRAHRQLLGGARETLATGRGFEHA
jgi:hypothetical protein